MPSNHLILCRPFYSCLQCFIASGSFLMSWFFTSGGQSIGASASASVLSINIQGSFPLVLTGLISLLSKGLSRIFSSTTIGKPIDQGWINLPDRAPYSVQCHVQPSTYKVHSSYTYFVSTWSFSSLHPPWQEYPLFSFSTSCSFFPGSVCSPSPPRKPPLNLGSPTPLWTLVLQDITFLFRTLNVICMSHRH